MLQDQLANQISVSEQWANENQALSKKLANEKEALVQEQAERTKAKKAATHAVTVLKTQLEAKELELSQKIQEISEKNKEISKEKSKLTTVSELLVILQLEEAEMQQQMVSLKADIESERTVINLINLTLITLTWYLHKLILTLNQR